MYGQLTPAEAAAMLGESPRAEVRGGDLTHRERSILRLLPTAWRNKEIAAQLGLTTGTVKVYMYRIFTKLGVGSRLEAAFWVRDHAEMLEEPTQ